MENEASKKDKEKPKPRDSQIEDIIYTLKPMVLVENIFGIFKYSYKDKTPRKPNRLMQVMGLLITVAYTAAFAKFIKLPSAIINTEGIIDAVSELPSFVILFQYFTTVITKTLLLNDTMIDICKSLTEIDNTLRVKVIKDFYRKCHRFTVINLSLLIVSHIVTDIIDNLLNRKIDYFKIIVLFLYIEQDLELLVFCELVHMVKNRLQVINDYIAIFVVEQKRSSTVFTVTNKEIESDKYNFIGKATENNMKLRELAITYDRIGETCAMINDAFNFQIFMDLLSTFTYIVVSIWTILYYLRTPGDDAGELLTVMIWSVITIFSVIVLAFSCEGLQTTRKNTRILVNEIIMDYDLPRIMRVQAKAFMELIEAWPLRVFVYDMFSVDITLILKFISVATTFLIIVIQVSHLV